MKLLVRNKVKAAERWKRVFDEQGEAGRAYGLTVEDVWQSVDTPDEIWFVLDVEDRARAEAYMALPESAEVGERAGFPGLRHGFYLTVKTSSVMPGRGSPALTLKACRPAASGDATGMAPTAPLARFRRRSDDGGRP